MYVSFDGIMFYITQKDNCFNNYYSIKCQIYQCINQLLWVYTTELFAAKFHFCKLKRPFIQCRPINTSLICVIPK